MLRRDMVIRKRATDALNNDSAAPASPPGNAKKICFMRQVFHQTGCR